MRPCKSVCVAQATFFFLSALVPVFSHLLDITFCLLCLQNFPSHCKLCYPTLFLLLTASLQCHPPVVPGNSNAEVLERTFIYMLSKVPLRLIIRLLSKNSSDLETSILEFMRN